MSEDTKEVIKEASGFALYTVFWVFGMAAMVVGVVTGYNGRNLESAIYLMLVGLVARAIAAEIKPQKKQPTHGK